MAWGAMRAAALEPPVVQPLFHSTCTRRSPSGDRPPTLWRVAAAAVFS